MVPGSAYLPAAIIPCSFPSSMNPLDRITVVLVEPSTPGNIGATARVLKNTGISRLVLVKPCPWNTPEARWMAHGSGEILDACKTYPDLNAAVADAHFVIGTTHRLGRFREVCSAPRQSIARIASLAYHHEVAIVFGREKDGLWRNEIDCCHQLIRFPSATSFPSFNLSHAVLLFTYELFHAVRGAEVPEGKNLATAAERERLYQHLGEAMDAVEFNHFNDNPRHFARILRGLFNRIELEKRDVMAVHKICGQIRKFAARHKTIA